MSFVQKYSSLGVFLFLFFKGKINQEGIMYLIFKYIGPTLCFRPLFTETICEVHACVRVWFPIPSLGLRLFTPHKQFKLIRYWRFEADCEDP